MERKEKKRHKVIAKKKCQIILGREELNPELLAKPD